MSLTLTTAKARVGVHLNDTGQLIWSETMLETALREALQAIGRVLGETLTLSGLDGAGETSLPDDVEHILITGGGRVCPHFPGVRGGLRMPARQRTCRKPLVIGPAHTWRASRRCSLRSNGRDTRRPASHPMPGGNGRNEHEPDCVGGLVRWRLAGTVRRGHCCAFQRCGLPACVRHR